MSQQTNLFGELIPGKKPARSVPAPGSTEYRKAALYEPFTQCISVSPSYFTIFNDLSTLRRRKKLMKIPNPNPVVRIKDTGTLSRSAASRMKRSIEYLSIISREKRVFHSQKNYSYTFKQSFITLTLSSGQSHSDNWIKNHMLKNFIDALRKRYPAISYVWRAEVQKNGNIHFHILTDHFIPMHYVSYLWNKIQYKNGYLDVYLKNKGHMHAPSTEIKKVRSDKDLAKYMRKYMIKNLKKKPGEQLKMELDQRIITGKLWGCSDNLLLKPYSCEVDALSVADREFLFQNECLITDPNFQVFALRDLKSFFQQLSSHSAQNMREHFMQLFHRVPIPNINYSTHMNYSYAAV